MGAVKRIVAVDQSLRCSGLAAWDQGLILTRTLDHPPVKKGDVVGAIERLECAVGDIVSELGDADMVILEGYAFARPNFAHQIGELGGLLKWSLMYSAVVPFAVVPPAALKKFATGKGNAGKPLVLTEAVKRLGYEGSDHNAADARWLLEMALHRYVVPGRTKMPKDRLPALEKGYWPPDPEIPF